MENKENVMCSYCKSPKMILLCLLMMVLMFGLFYFLFFKNISFKIEKTSLGIQPVYADEISVANKKAANKTIVYYFHGNFRCSNCMKFEAYTKEAVQKLNGKNVEMRIINTDEPQNKHYVNDYGLYTKSVVLSKVKNGKQVKYKNLNKIWDYVGNKDKFENYIIKEIKGF